MTIQWFVFRDGKEQGPFTSEQLKSFAASGTLQRTDIIRRSDKREYVQAHAIRELFQSLDLSPPSRPPVRSSAPPAQAPRTFQFMCPRGHLLHGDKSQIGMQTQCPLCGMMFLIPGASAVSNSLTDQQDDGPWLSGTELRAVGFACGLVLLVFTIAKFTILRKSDISASLPDASIALTVADLSRAYKNNELAADKKYKGKILEIVGEVREVGKENGMLGEDLYVELYGHDRFDRPRPHCYFRSKDKDKVADLKPDTRTTIRGKCDGLAYGGIVFKGCSFVDKVDLRVNDFIKRAKGRSFTYHDWVDTFGLPSSESTPAPISDQLTLWYHLKDGDVSVSLDKQSWRSQGELLIHDVDRYP